MLRAVMWVIPQEDDLFMKKKYLNG